MATKKKSLGIKVFLLVALVIALASIALTLSTIKTQDTDLEAARGGSGGPGKTPASISLDQTDPHLGDTVTFTTSGGAGINLVCYEGAGLKLIYVAYQATGTGFLLGGTASDWKTQGGPAECSAYLYGSNTRKGVVAATYFHAEGAR